MQITPSQSVSIAWALYEARLGTVHNPAFGRTVNELLLTQGHGMRAAPCSCGEGLNR
jgi:hypothetical protein